MTRIWIPIYEEDEGDDCDDEEEVENSAPLPSTWPISLQRFVDRSFSQCVTQEKVLVTFSENILFTKNWEANPDFPLPKSSSFPQPETYLAGSLKMGLQRPVRGDY